MLLLLLGLIATGHDILMIKDPCTAQAAGRRVAYHTFAHVLDLDISFHLERPGLLRCWVYFITE
jgi:hypothetical protein